MPTHFRRTTRLLVTLLFITSFCTSVRAQIRISRQVIATSVFSSTPNGNAQQLKMTATAGEVFVGTQRGDVKATVGFQQPDDDVTVAVITLGERRVNVRTYPNPTIDQLFVDLTETEGVITELQLLDLYGRTVLRRQVTAALIDIPEVARLPGGTYFLKGTDAAGQPYNLGTVLLAAH